jgi:hypothetical protein
MWHIQLATHINVATYSLLACNAYIPFLTNTCICVAIDPCNTTLSNACWMRWYKSYQHSIGLIETHICVAKAGVLLYRCR